MAFAPGAACFIAGQEYAHGGLSLQECLVPIIKLTLAGAQTSTVELAIESVVWKGLRCAVVVSPQAPGLRVDIRLKPALASSSLVAAIKAVESGKANLAIAEDEHMGSVAVVVVLGPDGAVLQKVATTIGG